VPGQRQILRRVGRRERDSRLLILSVAVNHEILLKLVIQRPIGFDHSVGANAIQKFLVIERA
jgi:hypothetical protein